jgi:hypothetical protein
MRLTRTLGSCLLTAGLLLPAAASAGPMQDFERQLTATYAHYRAALMQTNQKNKEATEKAIADFEIGWAAILARKASPPPQYMDDHKWSQTLDAVAGVLAEAKGEAAKGELAKSHNTLEAIRDLIGDMRQRNGIITFSDRMNTYHEQMERVVEGRYSTDANGLAKLREDVAVLAFVAEEVERYRPADLDQDQAFKQGLADMKASIVALQAAVRAGDTARLDGLRKALKPPYSRLFAKYG